MGILYIFQKNVQFDEWMGVNLPQLCIRNQFTFSKIVFQNLPSHMIHLTRVCRTLNSCFRFASDQGFQVVHLDIVCNPRLFAGRNSLTRLFLFACISVRLPVALIQFHRLFHLRRFQLPVPVVS